MWNSCLGNVLFAREGPGQSCSDFWMSRVQAANALLSSAPCLFYNQQSSPAQSCVSHLRAWCIAHKVQLITGCVAQLIWCRSEKHHSAAGSPENNASLCISALGRVGKIYCLQIMRMGEVVSWGMGWRQGAWGMSSSGSPGCSLWHDQSEMNQGHSASPLSRGPVQELNLSVMQHLPNTGASTRCPWRWAGGDTKKLVKIFVQFINTWRELKGKDISRKITSPHQSVNVIERFCLFSAGDWHLLLWIEGNSLFILT